MSQKEIVLHLYRSMTREAGKFASYNFREYTKRRVALGFRENKGASPEAVKSLIAHSLNDMDMLKRQTLINSLYSQRKVVIE
eukprot:gene404-477_t